jgi:hypothetical protein
VITFPSASSDFASFEGLVSGSRRFRPSKEATKYVLTFEVNKPPQANSDSAATMEQAPTAPIFVLLNDADPDLGDTLSLVSFGQGINGAVAQTAPGQLVYTPQPGFFGNDTFTYTVQVQGGLTAVGTVTLTVQPANPPLATNDETATEPGLLVDVTVLSNDSGNGLAIHSFTPGTSGSVTQSSAGILRYTPNADFHGTDSFSYTIVDSRGLSSTAQVSVFVGIAAWDGGGDGSDWNDERNWLFDRLPTAQSDVVLDLDTPVSVQITSGNPVIHSLTTDETLTISGTTLSIDAESVIESGGLLTLTDATLGGSGKLINQSVVALHRSTVSALLRNEGSLLALGENTISGSLSTTSTAEIVLDAGDSGDSTLTVAQGFTNAGRIELLAQAGSVAKLEIESGALANAQGGVIKAAATGSGGSSTVQSVSQNRLHGSLTNQGGVEVAGGMLVVQGGQFDATAGRIDIAAEGDCSFRAQR